MYLGLLLFLLPPMSLQCGISTHTEIGYRCPLCDVPCLAIAQCVVCKVQCHCIFYGPGIRYSDIFCVPCICSVYSGIL